MGLELLGLLGFVKSNDNRLKDSACPSVYCDDLPGPGRSDRNARQFLVLEERLTESDPVAFGNTHRRFQVYVVHPHDGNMLYGRRIMNALFRHAVDG